jgi:hypothetical protein
MIIVVGNRQNAKAPLIFRQVLNGSGDRVFPQSTFIGGCSTLYIAKVMKTVTGCPKKNLVCVNFFACVCQFVCRKNFSFSPIKICAKVSCGRWEWFEVDMRHTYRPYVASESRRRMAVVL